MLSVHTALYVRRKFGFRVNNLQTEASTSTVWSAKEIESVRGYAKPIMATDTLIPGGVLCAVVDIAMLGSGVVHHESTATTRGQFMPTLRN
jgi:hypothetical protein